ncbi:hypothetical protein BDQ17DRAFT_222231 [Cyathus striatus]|nr:hypothetical protein BDQ17DRAFT_222231 [Cyathus striatus]
MSDEEEDAQEESVIHAQSDLKALDESRLKGASKKGKRNRIVQDDADDVIDASESPIGNIPSEEATKENLEPPPKSSLTTAIPASGSGESSSKPDPPKKEPQSQYSSLTSRYTIAPRTKSTPMSELIRKVNSLPGSPFASPSPGLNRKRQSVGLAYSPYLKSSRSMLSKIAPLHPNRRTPPPPLPPPPPRKKTKKELEREEKWEEELIESVGGITEWACMTDAERKEMRKAKWEREMCGWDD